MSELNVQNHPHFVDLTGTRFQYLTVVNYTQKMLSGRKRIVWICLCDCGQQTIQRTNRLKHMVSCGKKGCTYRYASRISKHHAKHPLYPVWTNMRQRCNNPNNPNYYQYGGRGISVCKQWDSFEQFCKDVGHRLDGLSLDRIDNNGNYEPSNVRWASQSEQTRNSRRNVLLTFNNETRCLTEWSEITGISDSALRQRIRRGWSVSDALTTPIKQRH